MKRIFTALLSFAILGSLSLPSAAQNYNSSRHDNRDKSISKSEAAAIGIASFATGIVISSALAGKNNNEYRHKNRYQDKRHIDRTYKRGQYGAPYSPEWYRYCATTYRSFNPKNGRYKTRHGRSEFCTMPQRNKHR